MKHILLGITNEAMWIRKRDRNNSTIQNGVLPIAYHRLLLSGSKKHIP